MRIVHKYGVGFLALYFACCFDLCLRLSLKNSAFFRELWRINLHLVLLERTVKLLEKCGYKALARVVASATERSYFVTRLSQSERSASYVK